MICGGRGSGARAADAPNELAPPGDAAVNALGIDPLELAIGFGLVSLVDQRSGGTLLARVGVVRRQIASDLGIVRRSATPWSTPSR